MFSTEVNGRRGEETRVSSQHSTAQVSNSDVRLYYACATPRCAVPSERGAGRRGGGPGTCGAPACPGLPYCHMGPKLGGRTMYGLMKLFIAVAAVDTLSYCNTVVAARRACNRELLRRTAVLSAAQQCREIWQVVSSAATLESVRPGQQSRKPASRPAGPTPAGSGRLHSHNTPQHHNYQLN